MTRSGDFWVKLGTGWRTSLGDTVLDRQVRARLTGAPGAPVIAVLGGIAANRGVTDYKGERGWWRTIAHPGGAIDLDQFQVLSLEFVPFTFRGTAAPIKLAPIDHANLMAMAMDTAGIRSLHTFVGASYGGMVALAFARAFPERVDQLVVISAAHRAHPAATASRGLQRRIIRFALAQGDGAAGVNLARQLAMMGYRTAEEFDLRFKSGLDEGQSQACAYLISNGERHAEEMSPARYLTLSEALDRHSEIPEYIRTPAHFIAVKNDSVVPLSDMRALHRRYGGRCELSVIEAVTGHDAFLTETDAMSLLLSKALPVETLRV